MVVVHASRREALIGVGSRVNTITTSYLPSAIGWISRAMEGFPCDAVDLLMLLEGCLRGLLEDISMAATS